MSEEKSRVPFPPGILNHLSQGRPWVPSLGMTRAAFAAYAESYYQHRNSPDVELVTTDYPRIWKQMRWDEAVRRLRDDGNHCLFPSSSSTKSKSKPKNQFAYPLTGKRKMVATLPYFLYLHGVIGYDLLWLIGSREFLPFSRGPVVMPCRHDETCLNPSHATLLWELPETDEFGVQSWREYAFRVKNPEMVGKIYGTATTPFVLPRDATLGSPRVALPSYEDLPHVKSPPSSPRPQSRPQAQAQPRPEINPELVRKFQALNFAAAAAAPAPTTAPSLAQPKKPKRSLFNDPNSDLPLFEASDED